MLTMQIQLKLRSKPLNFPQICPQHPHSKAEQKVRVKCTLPKLEGEQVKRDGTFFSFREHLDVPVCEKCERKYKNRKRISYVLGLVGILTLLPLILLGLLYPRFLENISNLWPILIMLSFLFIFLALLILYMANRLPGVLPIYSGKRGFEVYIRSKKEYIEQFIKMNDCEKKGFWSL